jgi:hypothetical protein
LGDVTLEITAGAVGTTELADDAVTTGKIATGAVETSDIASTGNDQVLVTDATGVVEWIDKSDLETVTSLSQNTGTGVISYVDEDGGTAETANVVSTASGNQISVGADGGAYLAAVAMPSIYATGKVVIEYVGTPGVDATNSSLYQTTVTRINEGDYQVTFSTALANANYIIQLSILDCGGDCPGNTTANNDDPGITYYNQTAAGFRVNIGDSDNGSTPKDDIDLEFMFTVILIP